VTNWRVTLPMIAVVLAVWLLGTWITKYSLEEMALLAPIAIAAIGALAAVLLLWAKVIRDAVRRRRPTPSVASDGDAGRLVDDRKVRAR
jgi:ABC-type microcin C transport system permease subunit YejB